MSKIVSYVMGFCCLYSVLIAQQQPATPRVEVPILPKSRAMSPTAPANATNKGTRNSIGQGRVAVTAAAPSAYWEEEHAISQVYHATESTAFLNDAKTGILYAYRKGDFACNDKNMTGHVLEALYTEGNSLGRPAGSGWYVADLNAGECGAPTAGLYGCKFTAEGQHTECGQATMNHKAVDIDVAQ